MKKNLGLYIHFPFCKVRCGYCGFFTLAGKEKLLPEYARTVVGEIKMWAEKLEGYEVDSIYMGGGTPSMVAAEEIERILDSCRINLRLADDVEVTIEANPESVTEEKLTGCLETGVNRLSLGLQAWQDGWLKKMGRLYGHDEFEVKYDLARKCGFGNIGIDLIFGIPEQTLDQWRESVEQVVRMNPEHVSCYSLELDKQSAWGRLHRQGKLAAADEEVDRDMYGLAKKLLEQAGYRQYEISNWAKPGYECGHNLAFWQGSEYLGLGAGAYSRFGGKRWENVESIEEYCSQIDRGESVGVDVIQETQADKVEENVMLGLRLIEGIELKVFEDRFGVRLDEVYGKQIKGLAGKELMSIKNGRLRLTSNGLDVADSVTREMLV